MNNVYEENKCTDLRAEFNDLREKFYQIKAAKSTLTHFSYTYTPHKPCSYCSNPYLVKIIVHLGDKFVIYHRGRRAAKSIDD
jgi:hypothetical protein